MCLNKDGGINEISRILLVMCKNLVAHHRNEFLNFCITSGVYPNTFKIYRDISNFRLVSVLSNLTKVFENIIYKPLQIVYRTSNFLTQNQFGFRKNQNTELATLGFWISYHLHSKK